MADVFSEDSMVGFVTGPLNNTGTLYGGRYTVVSKSPVTGGWNDANSDDAYPLSSQGLQKYKVERYYCTSCTLGYGAFLNIPSKRWELSHTTLPEYETMAAFCSLLLNKDIESVCRVNDLCNEYGFDTISAGSTVAWAMECYNNGVLSLEELDGIDLK